MATGDTYTDIGGARYIAVGKPGSEDQAGYGALTWAKVLGIVSTPEAGDTFSDVGEATLDDGRKEYLGGMVDGGAIDLPIKYIEGDAGQAIFAANVDGQTVVSYQDVDVDGTARFVHGRLMSRRRREKSGSSQKGHIYNLGINSATFTGTEETA